MLDANSSILAHCAQNIGLVLLSIIFLPFSTVLVSSCLFYNRLFRHAKQEQESLRINRTDESKGGQQSGHMRNSSVVSQRQQQQQRIVLVTGVSMTKGLALARLFYQAGHRVVGADFEPNDLPLSSGRMSKAVDKFYRLNKPSPSSTDTEPNRPANQIDIAKHEKEEQEQKKESTDANPKEKMNPYVESLLSIVVQEEVDLWVSCSGVASAIEDGEAKTVIESRTTCRAIQFDVETTKTLHEKHTFIARAKELGLNVPDTHTVTSAEQIRQVLFGREKDDDNDMGKTTKYIMKTIGMDDVNRGNMTLLPKSTVQETLAHLSRVTIDEAHPWILQQFIPGQREFCTHALIIRGCVRAFVACPSAELLMHYEMLPSESSLSRAMLAFTRTFAEKSGKSFTGHLSFDFLVEEDELRRVREQEQEGKVTDVVLWPIECNPRAHTAVVLFNDTVQMVHAYMTLLDERSDPIASTSSGGDELTPTQMQPIMPIHATRYKYFWLPHDLVVHLILPVYQYLASQNALADVYAKVTASAFRVLPLLLLPLKATWHDGTFVFWDPLPAWWLWHVQWPGMFLLSLSDLISHNYGRGSGRVNDEHGEQKGRKDTAGMWSRANVSTGKMFGC